MGSNQCGSSGTGSISRTSGGSSDTSRTPTTTGSTVFTEAEQTAADAPPNTAQYYAGRYAAKEAVAKALGTGFTEEVAWIDVEICRKPTGAPGVQVTGGAAEVARSLGITGWLVSISHSGDYAVASVIAIAES